MTHGDAAARGHPCPFVPCFGVGPSLFRGLDNPKNLRCRRESAGSQTGAGVSARGAAPQGLGFAAGEKTLSLQYKVF